MFNKRRGKMMRVFKMLFSELVIVIAGIYINITPCCGYSEFSENEVENVVINTVEVYLYNDWKRIDKIDYILSYNGGEVVLFDPYKKEYIKEKLGEEFEFVSFPGNKKFFRLGLDEKAIVYNSGLMMNKKLRYKIKEIEVHNNLADVVLDLNVIRGDIINDRINKNDVVYTTYLENIKNPPIATITLRIQLKKTINGLGRKHYFLTSNEHENYNKYDNAIFANLYRLIWFKYNEINYRMTMMPADEYLESMRKSK